MLHSSKNGNPGHVLRQTGSRFPDSVLINKPSTPHRRQVGGCGGGEVGWWAGWAGRLAGMAGMLWKDIRFRLLLQVNPLARIET